MVRCICAPLKVSVNSRIRLKTIVAENARADISDVLFHPTEKTVQAVAFTHVRKHWEAIDEAIRPHIEHLRSVAGSEMDIASVKVPTKKDWSA